MKKLLIVFFLNIMFTGFAQVGGTEVYSFLNIPSSARQMAMGGATNTIEGDVNMPMWNPAMLHTGMANKLAVNYTSHLAGSSLGAFNYTFRLKDTTKVLYTGVQYLDQGKFTRANENGVIDGQFRVFDAAVVVGYAFSSEDSNITVGTNVKLINSVIDTYTSTGIAFDIAAIYRHSNRRTIYSFVARNIGVQLTSYDGLKKELPFQVNLGVSSRLEHLPLRWYANLENLQQWDLSAPNPSNGSVDIDGNFQQENISFLDNAIRHVVVGAELFSDKTIAVRAGYNFRRQKELSLNGASSYGGFSYGFGLNLEKITFNFAMTKFHPSTNASTFSLVVDLN